MKKIKPVVFDLFCGLGGWTEAFIAAGYQAIGFDIEAHDYGNGGYPGTLVLCDVRTISGAELVKTYGIPNVIVASPPCQEFSYMAMPWSKAKEKMRKILADPKEQVRLCDLFNQCFRIQREVSASSGRYIPIVIENVRGAQRWVGKSRWNFGSFHLWGDVPALMPIPGKIAPGLKLPAGNATSSMWSERPIQRLCDAGVKVPSEAGCRTDVGNGERFTSRDCGVKAFTPQGGPLGKNQLARVHGSKSKQRKQASAEIAKIPRPLAEWIAKIFKG